MVEKTILLLVAIVVGGLILAIIKRKMNLS